MIKCRFSDFVLDARTGLNPRKNFVLGNGENYYVTIKDIVDGKVVFSEKTARIDDAAMSLINKRSRIKKGDILFTSIGRIGETVIIEERPRNWNINESVFCFTLELKKITREYFCWLFKSKKWQAFLEKASTGSTFHSIKMRRLNQTEFELPSLEEQAAQSAVLSQIKKEIDLVTQQISFLDEQVKSLFNEMFGDPQTNDKGWTVKRLGDLCEISRGGSPRPIQNYLGGTIPWIKIGDATDGDDFYITHTAEHIIPEGVKRSRFVKEGSLVFANCGVSLGFCRILKLDGCIHDGWLAFQNIDSSIDKVFLLATINELTEHFRDIAPGGTQPNLNTKIMSEYEQIVPPIDLQRSYVAKRMVIDKLRFKYQRQIELLNELMEKKMEEYFGGEDDA